MDLSTTIGIAGAFLILVGFFLNEFHYVNSESPTYDVINFIGGLLLTYYSVVLWSLPFFVLNVAWSLLALKDIVAYSFRQDQSKPLKTHHPLRKRL